MLKFKLSCSLAFYVLSFALLCGCQNKQLYKDSQIMMGTIVEVISSDKRAKTIAFREIKRIEDLLSKYKEDSEISRLNKLGRLNVSYDTLYVLNKAKYFWIISNGAFDVTVGPLMDIWGFTDKNYKLPDNSKIKAALKLVGFNKIIIDENNSVVKFNIRGIKIDLGAIAKGYAVDCAIKKLKQAGIKSCLINAGGQIYCLGDKFGRPWNIALQNPRGYGVIDYLQLQDKAVATSGDYQQYFINRNKRYSHIFNPHTGYPADSGVISVTVIAPDGTTADALATAIFVVGKEKGLELVRKNPGVETMIVEEKDVSHN